VALVMAEHAITERYACRLLEVDRSTCRYEPRPDKNAKLREALWTVARQQPRYGYRRLWALLVRPNREWAMDFVSDALATGRALRTFNLIDSYTKESLGIEVGTGIPSRQVSPAIPGLSRSAASIRRRRLLAVADPIFRIRSRSQDVSRGVCRAPVTPKVRLRRAAWQSSRKSRRMFIGSRSLRKRPIYSSTIFL
jgi:hypothetical protein